MQKVSRTNKDACINGNIFDEFRKIRHVKRDLPQTLDGSNNIPDEFANVYKKLYSTQDQIETLKIFHRHTFTQGCRSSYF